MHRFVLTAALTALLTTACSHKKQCAIQPSCSADAKALTSCVNDEVTTTDCTQQGQLCEAGACVNPWQYGSPKFDACTDEPRRTPETLAAKAKSYEDLAARLHVHPKLKWIAQATLKASANDPTQPAVDLSTATYNDVEQWYTEDNDGLWSSLYLASQAYRYAATKDPAALAMLRVLMDGEKTRMRITGVPGLFTRAFIAPGVDGLSCPTDDDSYTHDPNHKSTKWTQIRDDGCAWIIDGSTKEWVKTPVCGLNDLAGYCAKDNVSQDEYSGHMFALAAVYKLVDDPDIKAIAVDLLTQVGEHLVKNKLQFVDWDGKPTTFGNLSAGSLQDYPGFSAAMALSFIKIAAVASGKDDLKQFYDTCLLQDGPMPVDCLMSPTEMPQPYTNYFSQVFLYPKPDGCAANFNDISMQMLSLFDLIWFERDPAVLDAAQTSLDVDVMQPPDVPRSAIHEKNAWFDFLWAAHKKLGPGSDGPAYDAVKEGLCQLRQFPSQLSVPTLKTDLPGYCADRFGRQSLEKPLDIADRCPDTYMWWRSPYDMQNCTLDQRHIYPPQSYLLPYWMGRYYGFIKAED